MKKSLIQLIVLVHIMTLVSGMVLIGSSSWAQDPTSLDAGLDKARQTDEGLLQTLNARGLLQKIILWILGLVAVIALAVLIWGAFMFILSAGNEDRARLARRIILYAIIGLLLIGGSFFIVNTIRNLLVDGGGNP